PDGRLLSSGVMARPMSSRSGPIQGSRLRSRSFKEFTVHVRQGKSSAILSASPQIAAAAWPLSMTQPLHVIILAAGAGKRMKSLLPKVMQPIAGQPMLAHVIATARELQPAAIHGVYGPVGALER